MRAEWTVRSKAASTTLRVVPVVALLLAACTPPPAASSVSSSDPGGPRGAAADRDDQAGRPDTGRVPPVRLERIAAERAGTVETGRNPFRFGATPGSASAGGPRPAPPPMDLDRAPPGATRPEPRPTIPLKFIGIVEAPDSAGRLAVLSDAGGVYHGRQDDVIEGRYRIVRIGIESIEMEILASGVRQTIRLSGQ